MAAENKCDLLSENKSFLQTTTVNNVKEFGRFCLKHYVSK